MRDSKTMYERLSAVTAPLSVPLSYGAFDRDRYPDDVPLPYAIYMGSGADTMGADNHVYYAQNGIRLEYYFRQKDELKESALEDGLTNADFYWDKSGDVAIPEEGIYVIYYGLQYIN